MALGLFSANGMASEQGAAQPKKSATGEACQNFGPQTPRDIDKAAGEPVDVLVNSRIVARGEVVVIEDNFGVRITEILSPQDRLMKLNEVA